MRLYDIKSESQILSNNVHIFQKLYSNICFLTKRSLIHGCFWKEVFHLWLFSFKLDMFLNLKKLLWRLYNTKFPRILDNKFPGILKFENVKSFSFLCFMSEFNRSCFGEKEEEFIQHFLYKCLAQTPISRNAHFSRLRMFGFIKRTIFQTYPNKDFLNKVLSKHMGSQVPPNVLELFWKVQFLLKA